MSESGPFEYVRAIIIGDELRWEYKINTSPVQGSMSHDDDISDYTDMDIIELTMSMVGVPEEQKDLIEIQYG